MDAMQILVIILSVFLALFLILAIVLVSLLIKVTKQIRTVTSTAQSAADKLNSVALGVSKFATPALVGKFIISQFSKFKNKG